MKSWDERKQEHLALSAAAAEQYDQLYEQANFATGSYMRYELEIVARWAHRAPSTDLALDLGCGTGRDSFVLSKFFDQVYGYDFAPEMIHVAERNKFRRHSGNVLFEVLDLDERPLPVDDASVAFVNTAFGMGSFVKNLEALFREVRRVLQPRGIAVFSFYNADALVNSLDLEWKPALAARVLSGEESLQVDFEGASYTIPARPYSLNPIRKKLEGNFHLNEITTYPTLSALFPQTLFASERARTLCTNVDQLLASNLELAAGPYIVAVCQTGGSALKERTSLGYQRVLELLRTHRIKPDVREHSPVRTMDDVRAVLNAPPSAMVKSVLVAVDTRADRPPEDLSADLYLAAVPADRKLDFGKLARVVGSSREHLRLATQIELESLTGFNIGSIPPFGMPKSIPVIVDTRIASQDVIWCGTGKATESLRLRVQDLRRLSAFSTADVSKPIVT